MVNKNRHMALGMKATVIDVYVPQATSPELDILCLKDVV